MWVNLVGSVFVIMSSTIMGFWISEKERLRVVELRELQRVMHFVMNEIAVFNTIFSDILRKVSNMDDLRVGLLFKKILTEMEKGPCSSIEDAWKNSFIYGQSDLHLLKEDIEILISFGMTLERSDMCSQVKNLEIIVERLKELELAANEKYRTNSKLFKSGGILTGFAISIILF